MRQLDIIIWLDKFLIIQQSALFIGQILIDDFMPEVIGRSDAIELFDNNNVD